MQKFSLKTCLLFYWRAQPPIVYNIAMATTPRSYSSELEQVHPIAMCPGLFIERFTYYIPMSISVGIIPSMNTCIHEIFTVSQISFPLELEMILKVQEK